MDNYEFSNRIIELRKQKGLSQKELGDLLGVSNKAVSKWENGESMPKTTTMIKLAELFEIDANELIGFEAKAETSNEELDKLRSENAILSSKLNAINKRRKRTLIFVIIICIISIIASSIIAFCINTDKSINASIANAGKDGTKIIFADKEFVAPNDFSSYVMANDEYYNYVILPDEKNATFVDTNGKEQKVVIECNSYSNFVKLTVKGKSYYYCDKKLNSSIINTDNIDCLDILNKTITKDDEYYDTTYYHSYANTGNNKAIKTFCKYYQDMGKPVDKKITQSFLGNKAKTVEISFSEKATISLLDFELGEFFKDDKGNVYFYDYVTTNSYSVGKELINFVY